MGSFLFSLIKSLTTSNDRELIYGLAYHPFKLGNQILLKSLLNALLHLFVAFLLLWQRHWDDGCF
jgi:hypothetical protein